MDIETAPNADEHRDADDEPSECAICDSEDSYIRYEGDTVCIECGHVRGGDEPMSEGKNPWVEWWEHRDENYDGFYGPDRIKFVGGGVKSQYP